MNEAGLLRTKVFAMLAWEKRKRREQVLATALCYSVVGAIVLSPLYPLMSLGGGRWAIPALLFAALAPLQFFRRRWRKADCAEALVRVDHALKLDERTITAWEILGREQPRPAEFLVLKEASSGLKAFEPQTLFPRQATWEVYSLMPLFALWFVLLWFDIGVPSQPAISPSIPDSQAERLREFSRELQEKAKREELPGSLKIGRELEKLAKRRLESRTSSEPFKRELEAVAKRMGAMGRTDGRDDDFLAGAATEADLKDLKAELEAARDGLNLLRGAGSGAGQEESRWREKLAALPQLNRQFALKGQQARGLGRNEIRSFLDKLQRQVSGELDRRTMLDAQQFIDRLLKEKPGNRGESQVQVARQGKQDLPADAEKARSRSNQPGKQPGTRPSSSQPLAGFRPGAAAQLKGMLGVGQSSSLVFPGKPRPEHSKLGEDEVMASYGRQAEAELNSEQVPEGLKETVKQYFLSLRQGSPGPE